MKVSGESDVIIGVTPAKLWAVIASADNSGTRARGALQGYLSLGLNDLLNIGAS